MRTSIGGRTIHTHRTTPSQYDTTLYYLGGGLAHSGHRLIGGSGLRLRIRNPLLSALSARQLVADALLTLRHHRGLLVGSLDRNVFLLSLVRRHFRALHGREALGPDFAVDDAAAEVVFAVFEVEEEDLHATAVGLVGFVFVVGKDGRFDRFGEGKNMFRCCGEVSSAL